MHFLTKKVQKGLHILFVYHIIDTLTHKQKAVKWKVVGTRIAVVYVKGFSMEQVYDKDYRRKETIVKWQKKLSKFV